MIHAQATKSVILFNPQSVATNGTASGTVNCIGFDYALIHLQLGTQTAANTDVLLRISEGDGTTFTTSTSFTMTTVAPDTSNGQQYQWLIDLKARKKNLKIEYSPSASAARLASAVTFLSRGENAPSTAAQRGVTAQVVV